MGTVVFALYALIFSALTLRHVSYALVALICMFAFEQWGTLYIPAIASNSSLVNILILALVIFGVARLPGTVALEFLGYPIRAAIILLLLYALLSTSWAPQDANATGRFIAYLPYLFCYVVLAPLLVRKSEHITKMLDTLTVLGGMLVILFAYVPEFKGRSITTEYNLDETVGLPLALGDFAGAILIIVMIRARGNFINICWALIVAGSALWLITKTGSRGQLAFVLMALLFCFPIRWKRLTVNRFMTLVMIVLLALIALAFVLTTENTLTTRLYGDGDGDVNTGAESRIEMVSILLNAWSSSDLTTLIFGLGNSASWSQHLTRYYPHVVPLEVLGELGLFGFIIFMGIVCGTFFLAFSNNLKARMTDIAVMDFAALFGCFLFALLISTKQTTLIFAIELMLYAVLAEKCYMLSAGNYVRRSKKKIKFRRRSGVSRRNRSAASAVKTS